MYSDLFAPSEENWVHVLQFAGSGLTFDTTTFIAVNKPTYIGVCTFKRVRLIMQINTLHSKQNYVIIIKLPF